MSGATGLEDHDVDALLAEADAAVAEGRVLGMIDDLSRRAFESRDPRLEQRMVELRHLAYAELDRTPGRPSWPRAMPDPFPGVDGVPEITAAQLSGDVLGGALVNHGCLRVNGLLTPEVASDLRALVEESFTAREQLAEGVSDPTTAPVYVPFEPGREKASGFGQHAFVRVVDVPRALCYLATIFDDTGLRAAVADYFNERPTMIANKWGLRRSKSGLAGTDLHQDGAFLGEGIRTVDCWIALSDCGPGTGRPGLDLIPRRFDLLPTGDEKATFGWSISEEAALAAAGSPLVAPVFRPGDALLFDERLPHRTAVGPELTTRYAIESWLVAPSSYPAKHVPVVL